MTMCYSGAMYTYSWNIKRCWPTYCATIWEGSIGAGTWRKIWQGEFLRRKSAKKELVRALQADMNRNRVWRVSEGGNSPVANNWSIKPWIIGLVCPNGEKAKPYDFWPQSWGPEPTEEEYEKNELYS